MIIERKWWTEWWTEMALLKTAQIKNAKPGKHHDGQGLYFVVSETSKKWVLRRTINGKRREWGLGAAADIGLADVREKAATYRRKINEGVDPAEERRRLEAARMAEEQVQRTPTFRETALEVHREHSPSWKNQKDVKHWLASLERYAFTVIGETPIDEVTGPMVRDILASIWLSKPDMARKLRQRIATILDVAHGKGYRDHEAPRRSMVTGLPKQPKVKHFAAMPWRNVPAFIADMPERLRANERILRAIQFTILTASRSAEVRKATWGEIDLDTAVWTRPAKHMKAGDEHIVPLSRQAIELLGDPGEGLLFPGLKSGNTLSDMTFTMPLRRAKLDCTVHGFRSSFRDWCSEATSTPWEVAEACLAHVVGDQTERAYARSDLLEKRRAVMQQWADFCGGADNVTRLEAVG
jgi:integrase